MQVNSGGTLAGNGTIDPPTAGGDAINSGGTLAPGTPGAAGHVLTIGSTLTSIPAALTPSRSRPAPATIPRPAITGNAVLSGNGTVVVTPQLGHYHATVYRS